MQIQVADVAAESTRAGNAHQCVQVRAIDVDLAAGVVYQRTDVGDVVFENAMRRRVGDHDRGQGLAVLIDLDP